MDNKQTGYFGSVHRSSVSRRHAHQWHKYQLSWPVLQQTKWFALALLHPPKPRPRILKKILQKVMKFPKEV